jgi:hypothetical protein
MGAWIAPKRTTPFGIMDEVQVLPETLPNLSDRLRQAILAWAGFAAASQCEAA